MHEHWHRRLARRMTAITLAAFVIGCAPAAEEPEEAPATEPAEEQEAPAPEPRGLDASILDDPARPAEEVAQDADRRALEVYGFFEIEPGMTVADLWPGDGYNTFLLSRAVGADGQVYAALGFYNDFQEGAIAQRFRERVERDALDNVTVVDEISEIPAGSVDVAITVRNYHDVYAFDGDAAATAAAIYDAVAPGGIVGIVEVATDREGWDADTHRLNEQVVIDDFTAAGFELVGESDLLANPEDDHSTSGFQEGGRHTMDRYILKFRKPAM